MFGWFGRKPKISDGVIRMKNAPVADDERPVQNVEKNTSLLQVPLDRDLYGQALKAKGFISLKAVHDEYERLVWRKLRSDESNDDANDDPLIENISKNEQRQCKPEVSVKFSPWNIVRDELIRVYGVNNLWGPGTETKIEMRCRLIVAEKK